MFRNKTKTRVLSLLLTAVLLFCFAGCAAEKEEFVTIEELVGTEFDMVPLGEAPKTKTVPMPEATGKKVLSNEKVKVDISNIESGYIMVKYRQVTTAATKCIITCPNGVKYTYNLKNNGVYETYPLSEGNGKYKVSVYKNVTGSKYSTAYSTEFDVKMKDDRAPFTYPNQYVNYKADSRVVTKAAELCKDAKTDLDKIKAVYKYVIDRFSYDNELAATVTSGYLPNLDKVLEKKKGICFDYAAVMTAMLRSQGIPCKLVIGYAEDVYHAWISTYTKNEGWINGTIFFNGKEWKLMDPTYASTGGESKEIMNYIGDTSNYKAMYLY